MLGLSISHRLTLSYAQRKKKKKPEKIYSYKYKEKNKHSFVEYADIIGSNLRDGEDYMITLEVCGEQIFVHIDDRHFLLFSRGR